MLKRGFMMPVSKAELERGMFSADSGGGSGIREMLRRWTPTNVTTNPSKRVIVVVLFAVLKPWNRIVDAIMTLVENVTKYVGLTLQGENYS